MERTDRSDHSELLITLLTTRRAALVAAVARRVPGRLAGVIAAEDIVQEASLEAVRSVGDFRPRPRDGEAVEASLWRWLGRIARHRLCDAIKAQRRLKRAAALAAAPGRRDDGSSPVDEVGDGNGRCPVRATADGEAAAALRRAMADLPADYRLVLELRFVHGLPVAEAAARLGRSAGAVAMLCNRGVARLRRALAPEAN